MKISARKLAVVAVIAALTTGASGYFMGLLQTSRAATATRTSQETNLAPNSFASSTVAPEAPRYDELRDRSRQPNQAWHSSLAMLAPAPAFTDNTPPLSSADLDRLRTTRESRRAYNGAPPTVPHPIDQYQSASCLACHGTPTRIDMRDVPQMSHAPYTHCIQCHAPQHGPGPALAPPPPSLATPALANSFSGQPAPAGGSRAYGSAPPVMPHTTQMRENCTSCHGPGGSSVIKTTHPQRQNCLQCHATDAARETLPVALVPNF